MRVVGTLDIPEAQSGNPEAGSDRLSLDPSSATNKLYARNSAGVLVPVGFGNPMTTADDIIIAGASGAPTRLAKGADGSVLTVDPVTHHLVFASNAGYTAGGAKQQAQYFEPSDLSLDVDLLANTQIGDTINFTVDAATSLVEVKVDGIGRCIPNTAVTNCYVQLTVRIDSNEWPLSGCFFLNGTATNNQSNPFAGAAPVFASGLAAGAHTVKLFAIVTKSGGSIPGGQHYANVILQPGASSGGEYLNVDVIEHKAGGLSWVWRGAYSGASTYAINEGVFDGGSAYICIQAGTGHMPASSPTYWSLLSSKGDTGATGATGASGLTARHDVAFSTGSLATNASATSDVTLHLGCEAYKLVTNRAARIRAYSTSAYRTADVARAIGVSPTGDHGLLLEVVTGATLSFDLTPVPTLVNMDGSPAATIYFAVTNLDVSTGVVTTTVTVRQSE